MREKSKGVSKVLIYKVIYKNGSEKIWGIWGNRRAVIPEENLEKIKELFDQENVQVYNYNDPVIDTLESLSDLRSERYIQSISLYKDKAVSEVLGEIILIGPVVELVVSNENEEVSFVGVINLINLTETVKISSSFSKIDSSEKFPKENEVNRIGKTKRDHQKSTNLQVTFDVNTRLEGFGTYVFKATVTFENGYSEDYEILVPVVQNEVF